MVRVKYQRGNIVWVEVMAVETLARMAETGCYKILEIEEP